MPDPFGIDWQQITLDAASVGARALAVLVVVIGGLIVYGTGRRVISRAAPARYPVGDEARRRSETTRSLARSVWRYTVVLAAGVVLLAMLPGALLPAAGVLVAAGLVVALGVQSLVRDVVAGFSIIIEGQLAVGDRVRIHGVDVEGTVEAIGLRTTVVRDEDGSRVFVANGSVTAIRNYMPAGQAAGEDGRRRTRGRTRPARGRGRDEAPAARSPREASGARSSREGREPAASDQRAAGAQSRAGDAPGSDEPVFEHARRTGRQPAGPAASRDESTQSAAEGPDDGDPSDADRGAERAPRSRSRSRRRPRRPAREGERAETGSQEGGEAASSPAREAGGGDQAAGDQLPGDEPATRSQAGEGESATEGRTRGSGARGRSQRPGGAEPRDATRDEPRDMLDDSPWPIE